MQRLAVSALLGLCSFALCAADAPPPAVQSIANSNGTKIITFTPSPAADAYGVKSSTDAGGVFTNDGSVVVSGNRVLVTNNASAGFFTIGATTMPSNNLLIANLLNRIAYGPTPDELERLAAIGPQAYINEQLNPEGIFENLDSYVVHQTNGVPPTGTPVWRQITVTGTISSSNLYVYLTRPGVAYIDDISLSLVTADGPGPNLIQNGDFENMLLTPPWVTTPNTINSAVSTEVAHSGSQSLRLVCQAGGSTQTDSLWQSITNLPFNFNNSTQRCQLSFWYLEATNSSSIRMRLGNSGVNASAHDAPPPPQWLYARVTGRATAAATFYLYLNGSGEVYIDDLKLVAGSVPEVGQNLLRNGNFEAPLSNLNWNFTADFTNSFISSQVSHSGSGSLKLVATGGGNGNGDSVFQTNIPGIVNGNIYTLSFWYLPPTSGRTITARLSGSATAGLLNGQFPDSSLGTLRRRLDNILQPSIEDGTITVRTFGGAALADLRAWHVQNAVRSKQQLLQVLLQFCENHFVTQHGKSVDYFDRFYDDFGFMDVLAANWEYREITKWRNALLDPNCNFYDLLRISAESPAMIVYLDSVDSNGSGNRVANENYAREIMELFAMGVDNGYDQQDITVMSRSWSGWSVEIVDPWNIDNPHAPRTERVGFYPGAGSNANSNRVGVWTFNFKPGQHGTNRAPVWCVWNTNATNPRPIDVKRVPSRFGPPWAGVAYNLYPTNAVPVRTGTNGIQDGYDVLAKIADLPFTMEYISVKLCRLFVHDEFMHGVYDYADPNRSPEAELIRRCMVAWDTPVNGRKGNIRAVLNTIFSSELFRSHGGSLQKVKTPIEFAVSTIRALSSTNASGGLTANTDGYSIGGRSRTASSAPLTRMGGMMLFDRDSPDGYPEAGPSWISAGTLAERIRFIQTTLMATNDSAKADGISGGNFNHTDPVGLLKVKLPPGSWDDASAVADFFLRILFPGEGRANLDAYKAVAVNFLNTSDNGSSSSPFASLGNSTTAYDTRVRAMVGMLMTLPRFQEQ
jgi:uncharacterized protein (DUF1800 family)